MQRVNVLQDVGLEVRDEHHVELVERLVDKADIVLLDRCVLGTGVGELGQGGEEGFDAGPGHLAKQAREHGLAATGTDGRGEDNLLVWERNTGQLRHSMESSSLDAPAMGAPWGGCRGELGRPCQPARC